jgi:hypothetical protein
MQMPPGSARPSRRAAPFTPSPKNIAFVDDGIALMYAYPELDPFLSRHISVALDHAKLNLDCAANRVQDAAELHQHPVTGGFHDPSTVLFDLRINQRVPMSFELDKSALLVGAHEAAVPSDIGR